jgi:hypothetical protein
VPCEGALAVDVRAEPLLARKLVDAFFFRRFGDSLVRAHVASALFFGQEHRPLYQVVVVARGQCVVVLLKLPVVELFEHERCARSHRDGAGEPAAFGVPKQVKHTQVMRQRQGFVASGGRTEGVGDGTRLVDYLFVLRLFRRVPHEVFHVAVFVVGLKLGPVLVDVVGVVGDGIAYLFAEFVEA